MNDTIHFDAPEFYGQDTIVLTVNGPEGKFDVVSEGSRSVTFTLVGGTRRNLSSPDSFRNSFPDGNLPENHPDYEWDNNGWFAVYETVEDAMEVMGEPMMSLTEAVNYALELAYGEL